MKAIWGVYFQSSFCLDSAPLSAMSQAAVHITQGCPDKGTTRSPQTRPWAHAACTWCVQVCRVLVNQGADVLKRNAKNRRPREMVSHGQEGYCQHFLLGFRAHRILPFGLACRAITPTLKALQSRVQALSAPSNTIKKSAQSLNWHPGCQV